MFFVSLQNNLGNADFLVRIIGRLRHLHPSIYDLNNLINTSLRKKKH